jgi:hypothetical protein
MMTPLENDAVNAVPMAQKVPATRPPARQGRKLQMRPLGMPSSPEINGGETSLVSEPVPQEKPVALSEILAKPVLTSRAKTNGHGETAMEAAGETEPLQVRTFGAPQDHSIAEVTTQSPFEQSREQENGRSFEQSVEPPMAGLPPQTPHGQVYASGPTPPDSGRWTREPVLVALLLAALVMLAFNTYSTLRVNGVADRLNASGPQATAAVSPERPWVGVDTIRTQPFANGGQPVTTVHIVNSGHEPAYDLRSNTVGSLRSSATPAPEIPAQKGPLATTGLLLPNTGGNLTFFGNTRALTAEEAGNVRSGQYVLWLAGRLDYKDAAGKLHATTFRYRYDPNLSTFVAAPMGNIAN